MPIARERVEQRLRDAASHAALTMLRAPLGAGKTSAAAGALAEVPGVVFLSAQPWNRDAFVRDLVQQIRTVRDEFGRLTLGALEAGADAERVARIFCSELARSDDPLTIVIDNAQVFADDAAFISFANTALETLPRSVHLVMLGRAMPALALGRTLSRGQVTVFDEQFLALDVHETIAFAKAAGRDLDEGGAKEMLARTDGWIAGVMLMLAAPGGTVPQAYLEEHLLPELGAANVALLEQLSVFETLDTRVLHQVEAFANVGERLATLRKLGAPIDAMSETRFRVHPMLRDLARARLAESGAQSAAHVQASAAYARAGNMAAALYHAEASGDRACAEAYLREHIEGAVATGNHARVRALAAKVVEQAENALTLYAQGLLEKANGNAHARGTFERALAAATQGHEADLAFAVRAQLLEHDLGHLASVDRQALDAFESAGSGLGVAAHARAAITRGWAEAISFDFSQSHARLEPFAGLGDESARFNTDILRAYVQTSLGDFDAAQTTLDELTRLLEGSDRVVLQALTLVWFARLALVWGNTNAASDAASHAVRIFDALDMRAEEAALYVSLAEIASHHGNVAAAVDYAERARGSADRAWYAADVGRVRAMAEIVLARAAFLGHDNAIARDLALRAAEREEMPSAQRALALAEASVYTLLAKPGDAQAIIVRAREAVANATPLDAADAVAISLADDTLAFLDAANGVAHRRELPAIAPFEAMIDRRAGLVTLEHAGLAVGNERRGTSGSSVAFETSLDRLTRDGPRFEARLVRAYASTYIKQKAQAPVPTVDLDLTAREFEILALLVDGLSNKEIAARLIVSPRTIETHVERVLGKLEVGSRSRAIAKALRLGLVTLENP